MIAITYDNLIQVIAHQNFYCCNCRGILEPKNATVYRNCIDPRQGLYAVCKPCRKLVTTPIKVRK